MYLALVDLYGQIVGSDTSSTLTVIADATYNTAVSYSPIIEGTS